MTRKLKEIVNQAEPVPQSKRAQHSDHVCIALALYNGGRYIDAQLASIAAQDHKNISILISDDGSADDGPSIVKRFLTRTHISGKLMHGPRKGYAQNFLSLAQSAGPSVPFLAFSDQDDVWKCEKISRAVRSLQSKCPDRPAIYCSRTVICDASLKPLTTSPEFERAPSFANALVQNIASGNTMVLNRAALDLVQDTYRHAETVVSHDWWVYQLVTGAGGTVLWDSTPSLFYRQHKNNLIGANNSQIARLGRIWNILNGKYRNWNNANLTALFKVRHWLNETSLNTLEQFTDCRSGGLRHRWKTFRDSGVYRQTRLGQYALSTTAFLGRL